MAFTTCFVISLIVWIASLSSFVSVIRTGKYAVAVDLALVVGLKCPFFKGFLVVVLVLVGVVVVMVMVVVVVVVVVAVMVVVVVMLVVVAAVVVLTLVVGAGTCTTVPLPWLNSILFLKSKDEPD
jgi:hypothetical protein